MDTQRANQTLYLLSNGVQDINSRHSKSYSKLVQKSKDVKSSNRNDILLGKATKLDNVG